MSLDGLAALQAKRDKAAGSARHVPPPRHASRKSTTAPPGTDPAAQTEETPPKTPTPVHAPAMHGPPMQEPAPVSEVTTAQPHAAPLVRATIYLQEADDLWLEQIAGDGRMRRPRVDASRSAVTRLALERLREQMSPAEIVAHLASKAESSSQTVGRKRL